MKKLTTIDFIEKSINIHGNKYDYSLVEYVGSKMKVKIICRIHGVFEQIPTHHLNGVGCSGNKKYTTEEFIKKATKIHNNRYDYSLVDYINTNTKVKIICKKHGIFEQTPKKHLKGQECPKCI